MNVTRPKAGLGALVEDVDARSLSLEQARALRSLMYEHKLLVLRGQSLDEQAYVTFARQLGRPQIYLQANYHHPEYPEIFVSSNMRRGGRKFGVAGTGQYWHTDYQFHPEPLSSTLVYPQVLPRGPRSTGYIDMVNVLGRLPASLERLLHGRRAIHEAKWRYKVTEADVDRSLLELLTAAEQLAPPVTHPCVIEHPVTHARSLYVSRGFTTGIEGVGAEEARSLLAELFDFIERPEHVHNHDWQQGDILYWDNRVLLHHASRTPPGEQTMSYRIGVYDDAPFYVDPDRGRARRPIDEGCPTAQEASWSRAPS